MNKKEYIKPKSKHIIVASAALLAGSLGGDKTIPTDEDEDVTAGGKFSLWEDED